MSSFIGDWHALLILLLAGILPNEIWRVLGLVFGGGIDESSELLVWVRATATAILAGVIALGVACTLHAQQQGPGGRSAAAQDQLSALDYFEIQ